MSDCRHGGRDAYQQPEGYDVMRLRIEFYGEEQPWMYPLAINGRKVSGLFVDGVRYVPAKQHDWDDCEVD